MTRPGHPVHQKLLDAVGLRSGMTVVDLGCGEGETLGAAATRARMNLVGLEADHRKLEAAAARLRGVDAWLLIQADLDGPCPLRDASVDAVLSHNVLEYLQDPAGSIEEAGRVLVPGGTAIWSHVDFAGILFNASDTVLNRRVIETHATFTPKWMRSADGYAGRRIPGLVGRSSLVVDRVDVLTITATRLDGDARRRIDQILAVLRRAAQHPQVDLSLADLDAWLADLEAADAAGEFFFAEPNVVVTSHKPTA